MVLVQNTALLLLKYLYFPGQWSAAPTLQTLRCAPPDAPEGVIRRVEAGHLPAQDVLDPVRDSLLFLNLLAVDDRDGRGDVREGNVGLASAQHGDLGQWLRRSILLGQPLFRGILLRQRLRFLAPCHRRDEQCPKRGGDRDDFLEWFTDSLLCVVVGSLTGWLSGISGMAGCAAMLISFLF